MSGYQLINALDAKQRSLKENIQLVDIRDSNSFDTAHAEGSFHLTNDTIADFIKDVEINRTIFVICYHGNSSKGVAQYLCDQGYLDVYSVNGGFEGWQLIE
ncbi:thiosulfate sulfurtransferase GlpE [Psychromonas sp. MB-3u-54]|uniref:thiosulfate sulfurtransferase GlpE n=1 Tax=Psychromonas sp. MB-3u-54 TaxID=2058319 RepID=UPI000C3312A5|nr:thiosulfate sulfurtransferase GlpE [Psychromonas sp. MB-3u-54]PKH01611.1 thiosulfate sulfurtransferase GlpE [Psychromonas sp. MB-3u-54]